MWHKKVWNTISQMLNPETLTLRFESPCSEHSIATIPLLQCALYTQNLIANDQDAIELIVHKTLFWKSAAVTSMSAQQNRLFASCALSQK